MPNAEDRILIEKFLSNNCDPAEAEKAAGLLETNTEALDSIVLTEDLDTSEIVKIPYLQKEEIINFILKTRQNRVLSLGTLLAAASIIGLIIFSWWYFRDNSGAPTDQKFSLQKAIYEIILLRT